MMNYVRALLGCLLVSVTLHADEMQVDPAGSFSILIPSALLPCALSAGSLACPVNNSALTIQVQKAPSSGASAALMALNAEDSVSSKPNFRMVKKETVSIDGTKTIVQTMTFNNLGNVTLPVMVRTVNAVLGNKTFELEVACNQSTCGGLVDAFDQALASLHLAKPGQKLKSNKASGSGLQNLFGNFSF
ncbi:MAG: hypothetical protein V4534_04010 [Myxococcota bacterium]